MIDASVEDGMGFSGLAPTAAERRQEQRERLATQICYRGYAYNVRSQAGVDSLRRAIERDGNG
jgi:hypothetical protein